LGLVFFKRYRMEFDLGQIFNRPRTPAGFQVHPWDDNLLDAHATAKYRSFCNELDANVFPCLGEREGCRRLMRDISFMSWFQPKATWLVTRTEPDGIKPTPCGTVQGLKISDTKGSIQNIGVDPQCRGQGLGKLLLWLALDGFKRGGLLFANLEVTARNVDAMRLYTTVGFKVIRTVYKTIEVEVPAC
jgi:[ribosomal protein S18]-alanine N-acetyltransferase